MFSIINKIESHFNPRGCLNADRVNFRRYNPATDEIVSHFSDDDWKNIFTGVDEKRLKLWNQIAIDRILLIAEDPLHNQPFGFICIIEDKNNFGSVLIHGGIWERNTHTMMLLFRGLNSIINILLNEKFIIELQCYSNNKKADRMQKALGFVEYKHDKRLSYKKLDINKFNANIINGRL